MKTPAQPQLVILFIMLFMLSSFTLHSQNNKKHQKFEKKLNEFRYSLYADLENVKDLNKLLDESANSDQILGKIKGFIKENEQKIYDYQQYSLSKYKDEVIEFDNFKKDTVFFGKDGEITEPEIVSYSQMIAIYGKSIGRLITLNPINHAIVIKNIYLSRTSSAMEMGTQSMKDAIASSKIKCTLTDKQKWKIWFDNYSHLYEFEYDLSKNEMKLTGVFCRK